MKNLKLMPLLLGLALILSSCGKDSMLTNGNKSSGLLGLGGNSIEYQLQQAYTDTVEIGTANAATVINSDTNFVKNTLYILRGYVFIGDGDPSNGTPTLDIDAGTIIRGSVNEASTLIINDDATILAEGTETEPIVFTSNADSLERAPGDWGGLVVLGEDSTNQSGTQTIEGIPESITSGTQLAQFGGSTVGDDSGVLKYMRIEYAGTVIGDPEEGNETNGLTLGAVGSGTEMHHIQVSFGLDDGYEFFGGTVDAHHLIAYRNDDDSFDTDFGYSGNIQFAVDYRDPELVNSSGSKGFESNSDDESDDGTPEDYNTKAVFSNVTLIGPGRRDGSPPIDPDYTAGVNLREGTALSLFNSVVIGFPAQLQMEDDETVANYTNGELSLENVTLVAPKLSDEPGSVQIATAEGASQSVVENHFYDSTFNNDTLRATESGGFGQPEVPLNEAVGLPLEAWRLPDTDSNPSLEEPIPASNSPLVGSASFGNNKLSGFDNVNYRGAFGPSGSNGGWNLNTGWISYTPLDNSY